LLCTDGVWSEVEDGEIADLSAGCESPREFGRALVDLAMERGSEDNLSVIVIQLDELPVEDVREDRPLPGILGRWLGRRPAAPTRGKNDSAKNPML
jgi:serine/threonine protein phosphatase PrpC